MEAFRMNAALGKERLAWLTNPRVFRWLLLAILVALSVQYTLKVMEPSRLGTYTKGAFNRWVDQIRLGVEGGEDIYAKFNYPNPPIMALILWPITELEAQIPVAGALTWFYLKVAMVFWCLTAVFRQVSSPNFPIPAWACALATLLSIRPILGDLSHGNINIFILFLVVAGLVAFSRGRDFLAGLFIALAVTCKVTPALFLVYFAWKGAWRTLLGATVGLILFFLIIPGAILGWSENIRNLGSWFDGMIKPYLTGAFVTSELSNQSLPGVIYRLLTHSPSTVIFPDNVYTPDKFYNFTDIGAQNAQYLIKGIMGLFALLVVWFCRSPIKTNRQSHLLWPEFALIAIGMLVFSERTWKHHCVTLLLPNAVLCYALAKPELTRRRKKNIVYCLVASQLFMFGTSTGVFPDSYGKMAQVYGAYVGSFFCLIAGLVVVRYPIRTAAVQQSPQPLPRAA